MKILIASKVGFIRHTLQRSLKRDGHRVTTTDTPQNTLEMIRNDCQIDVVVADWAVSGLSAPDIIRSIRQVERMNDDGKVVAPYVFVLINPTEAPDPDDDEHQANSGVTLAFGEVFTKPVNMQLLHQSIRAFANSRSKPAPVDVPQAQADQQQPQADQPVEVPTRASVTRVEEGPAPHTPALAGLVELPVDGFHSCFD